MRAKEFTSESAVDELKEKLPSLKKTDYDTIDELMQRISHKYKITGKKLHDMFVQKYKHTPDFWIKKYKEKLDEEPIEETVRKVGSQYRLYSKKGKNLGTFPSKAGAEKHEREVEYFKHVKEDSNILKVNEKEIMDEFVEWTKQVLKIESDPKIIWSDNTEEAQQGHHTGRHTDGSNEIWVYVKNRNLVDIMRTVFHEFVHVRQGEKGLIKPDSSYPGSPIEREADELAGKYIKIFGAKHPEIFQ